MTALELADQLQAGAEFPAYPAMPLTDAAAMLRRQHEAIQKLREALQECVNVLPAMYYAHRVAQKALKDTEDLK